MKREEFLFNHRHKVFTVKNPKNTFIIDTSNGYPVKVTTNVTKYTKWSDIFKGNYDYANPDRTPDYIFVNGVKYTYIDKKYGEQYLNYNFKEDNSCNVEKYKSKFDNAVKTFCKKIL